MPRMPLAIFALLAAVTLPHMVHAATSPQQLGFQGKLLDTSNNPRNGTADLIFTVYDAPTGGNARWTETRSAVPVTNGVFSLQLGAVTGLPTSLFMGASSYLGIAVDGGAEMTPRQQLLMAPSAFRALLADDLLPGNTNYVQNSESLQAASVFHVSSATVAGQLRVTGISTFTASGNQTFSLTTSSGILVQNGTLNVQGSGGVAITGNLRANAIIAGTDIILPAGSASSADGAMRWDTTLNQLYIGTGTANKTIVDTDSAQTMTNKTLNSTGGNLVDATHLKTRELAATVPTGGMALLWQAGPAQWTPQYASTISVVAVPFTPSANVTMVIDTMYLVPVVVPGTLILNQMRYRVTTPQAATTGDVGLYDTSGNLVAHGGASSADYTSTGAKVVNITGAPITIAPGQYYFAISANGTAPSVRAINLAAASAGVVKGLGTLAMGGGNGTTLPNSITLGLVVDGSIVFFLSANQ